MSSSGATRGGASLAQGLDATRPGTPATNLFFSTDIKELWVANAGLTAWQEIARVGNGLVFDGFSGVSLTAGANAISINGTFDVNTVGFGLRVAEGSNAKQGAVGAMTAGSVTVANTSVTASSRIFVCRGAGGTNPGAWYVSAQTAGTSFVVTSTNAADTGTGVFIIFEPG